MATRRPGAVHCLLLIVAVIAIPAGGAAYAQSSPIRATTVSGLLYHASFFHSQRIVVRGRLRLDEDGQWIDSADDRARVIGEVESTGNADADGTIEMRATFWDLGRIQKDDPRLASYDLRPALQTLRDREWPQPGEILVLTDAAAVPFTRGPKPTVRDLALEPMAHDGEPVTVEGRYRGRNLYGDVPQAPRQSRWDFVIQSGDSAVWVTGKEPKGRGFELGLASRVDTSEWLEVQGVLRRGQGLVWLEATDLARAAGPAVDAAPVAAPRAAHRPPPEVVFSTPVPDDIDVSREDPVRIQFSEDMEPQSFSGRVRASYAGASDALPVEIVYQPGNRALQIRFPEPLDPYRLIEVELLDGIRSIAGQPLAPYVLRYAVGG